MIDLRAKALPDSITIQGRAFSINTDYRVWLQFGEVFKNKDSKLSDFLFVFKDEYPICNFLPELLRFYANPNKTPHSEDTITDDVTLVDYIEDGEYIYASFLYDYGIDIIDTDLHWWKFKALFSSLSDECKIRKIMEMRGYKKPPKSYDIDREREKLRRIWSLDDILSAEELAALEEFNNL